ncbi:uncharacterized protein TNCV_2980751 [Trichonephila clavipes]|nr:uncharacterized protein TNCV_2980751 [Trichonephila clavipes]
MHVKPVVAQKEAQVEAWRVGWPLRMDERLRAGELKSKQESTTVNDIEQQSIVSNLRVLPLVPSSAYSCANKKGKTTRGLLATDHVILNHGQVTWTTPELEPPLLTTTPHQREDVSALDRFNVHRCPTRRVFCGTGLEPVTKQATVRYLYHSATAATP